MITPDVEHALNEIAHRDPDGQPEVPTLIAHHRHRLWALRTYGSAVWDLYCTPDWRLPDWC